VDDLREASYQPPTLDLKGALETLWAGADRAQLEAALPAFIQGRRWYSSRDRDLVDTKIIESVPLAEGPRPCMVTVVRAEFSEGPSELYLLPLAIESGERAQEMRSRSSQAIVAHLRAPMKEGAATALVVDALAEGGHCLALIDAMTQQQRVRGVAGQFSASSQAPIPSSGQEGRALESKPLRGEHRHAALVIGDKYLVKAQRRLDEGPTAELEVGRFLSGRNLSAPVAPLLGAFEYRARQSEPTTLLTLHGYVANEGTAWQHVSEHLGRFYQRVLTGNAERTPVARTMDALLDQALSEPVPVVEELVGSSLDAARLLGERLAELHLALSSEREHPHFAPEPYTSLAQRSSYQSMRNLAGRVLRSVRAALPRLDPRTAADAQQLLAQVPALYGRFEPLLQRKLAAMRIRVHGDFHLRKVLYTGKDFVIIDFDSDRSLSLADRRRRRSAVRDLASMIHAFDSAAFSVLMDPAVVREPDRPVAERWALLWQRTMAASFVRSYLKTAGAAPFVPPMREELVLRLETFVIARMLDEITESLSEKTPRTSHLLRGLTRILTHAPG
jgi:maltose alpha-D-glucosyltransferase/alpha-amylase